MEKKYIYSGLFIIVIVTSFMIMNSEQSTYQIDSQIVSEVTSSESLQVTPDVIYVQVIGAVENPGLYQMEKGQRVDDVLRLAIVEDANMECLNLAQKLVDEQNIIVPNTSQKCDEEAIGDRGVVNINKASEYELMTISGIGEAKAQAIIEYREQNGTFEQKSELLNVEGISEGLLLSIEDAISLS